MTERSDTRLPRTTVQSANARRDRSLDPQLRRQMLEYYNERAPEYEEAYSLGTGTSSIPDPSVFRREAVLLADIVHQSVDGQLIDLACGTAHWLPAYADRCSHITLFDQSHKMLAEAQKKVRALHLVDRCSLVQGDFFEYRFDVASCDCALVGFFLSHLTEAEEHRLFDALRTMIRPGGRFLILDSAWSSERARFNSKVERQRRRLNDGTTFDIYKRYCDRQDIEDWPTRYGLTAHIEYFGTAFYAVSGKFD